MMNLTFKRKLSKSIGKQILGDHDSEDDCTVMGTIRISRPDF